MIQTFSPTVVAILEKFKQSRFLDSAARGTSFAGHGDWRLPNAKELVTIVEERCYDPSLNETVFPRVPFYWYWSSSTYASPPDYAWNVGFDYGSVYAGSKSNDYHARLVRGGQWFGDFGGGGSAPPASTTLGSTGGPANPSGVAAEPVNTATGNYYYQHTDLTLPGRGLGVAFTHTYNAQDATVGPFGRGWTHRYHARLTENGDGSVVIRHGDGHDTFFNPNGSGGYVSAYPGVHDTLVKTGTATFQLTAKDRTPTPSATAI